MTDAAYRQEGAEARVIAALLDTLLPGDSAFPPVGSLPGVAEHVAGAAAPVLAALPADFAALPPDAREAVLRAIEAAAPQAFERMVTASYLAYYAVSAVQAVLQRDYGYAARPPQPAGHDLPPFDDALLARQRQRTPLWR